MSNLLLSIQRLSLSIKTSSGMLQILSDIDFNVNRSQVFGIVGESGCGKSLTALSIIRLLPPNATISGSIVFDGRDILTLSEADMRKIRGKDMTMIFQEPMTSLNPVLTAGYQIAEVITTHEDISMRDAQKKAIELMRAVRIPSPEMRAKDYPHQLSGGMRQRVMIAMAIACGPKLLIADEPTTALDVTIQAEILALLKDIRDNTGMSLLLITHDLAVISEQADYAAIMYLGQIMETASVRELLSNPLHPYTQGLLNSLPQERGRGLMPIKGFVPEPSKMPSGCRFSDRCPRSEDLCTHKEPLLDDKGSGHLVRCIKV